jgi:hypothetical protein
MGDILAVVRRAALRRLYQAGCAWLMDDEQATKS